MGNGYYPPGTEFDSTAPWNESPPEMRAFDVCISQTLSRNTTVSTKDYSISLDCDDEGVYYENVDTSNTDWKNLYLIKRKFKVSSHTIGSTISPRPCIIANPPSIIYRVSLPKRSASR